MFQLIKSFLLFGSTLFLWLLFQAFFLLIFLIGEALIVNINVTCLSHGFCLADGAFQFLEIFEVYVCQFQKLVIIKRTILKAALHNLFYLCFLQLSHHLIHIVRIHL